MNELQKLNYCKSKFYQNPLKQIYSIFSGKNFPLLFYMIVIWLHFSYSSYASSSILKNVAVNNERNSLELDIRTSPSTTLYRVKLLTGSLNVESTFTFVHLYTYYTNNIPFKNSVIKTIHDKLIGYVPGSNGKYKYFKSNSDSISNDSWNISLKSAYTLDLIINEIEYDLIKKQLDTLQTDNIDFKTRNNLIRNLCTTIGIKMPKRISREDYLKRFLSKTNKTEFFGSPEKSKKGYNLELLNGFFAKKFYEFDYVGALKRKRKPHGIGFINDWRKTMSFQGSFSWKNGKIFGDGILYERKPTLNSLTLSKEQLDFPNLYFISAGAFISNSRGVPRLNGYAQTKSPSGIIYEGVWKNGKAQGDFIVTLKNGEQRKETFSESNIANGRIYMSNGSYVEISKPRNFDNWSGFGTWSYKDFVYTGEIFQLLPHGKGTFKFKNGDSVTGVSKNGLLHGEAIYTYKNRDYCKCKYNNGAFLGGPLYNKSGKLKVKKKKGLQLKFPEVKIAHLEVDVKGDIKNPGRIFENTLKRTQEGLEIAVVKPLSAIAKETTIFVNNVGKEIERGWENGTIQKLAILAASYYIGYGVFEFAPLGWEIAASTLVTNLALSELLNIDSDIAEKTKETILNGLKESENVVAPVIENLKNALCSLSGVPEGNCNINLIFSVEYDKELITGLGDDLKPYYNYYKNTYQKSITFISNINKNQKQHQKLIKKVNDELNPDPIGDLLIEASSQAFSSMLFTSDLIANGGLSDLEFSNMCNLFNDASVDYKSILTLFSNKNLLIDSIEDPEIKNVLSQLTISENDNLYLSSSAISNYINKKEIITQQRAPANMAVSVVAGSILLGIANIGYKLYTLSNHSENYYDLKTSINDLKKDDKINYRKYMLLELALDEVYVKGIKKSIDEVSKIYYVDIPKGMAESMITNQSKTLKIIKYGLDGMKSSKKLKKMIQEMSESEVEKELKEIRKALEDI